MLDWFWSSSPWLSFWSSLDSLLELLRFSPSSC